MSTPSPNAPAPTAIRDYLRVAPFYDRLATSYSLGAIDRSRRVHLKYLAPASRILYAGAGTGQEAMQAASLGHHVQVQEPSPAMMARAQERRARLEPAARDRVDLVLAKAQDLDPQQRFDAIVCNYFLNLFAPHEIPWWLGKLAAHLEPQGTMWIADFAPLQGPLKVFAWAYHTLPLTCFRFWTGNAKHNPYDYEAILLDQGWSLQRVQRVGLTPWGPGWFACWQASPPRE